MDQLLMLALNQRLRMLAQARKMVAKNRLPAGKNQERILRCLNISKMSFRVMRTAECDAAWDAGEPGSKLNVIAISTPRSLEDAAVKPKRSATTRPSTRVQTKVNSSTSANERKRSLEKTRGSSKAERSSLLTKHTAKTRASSSISVNRKQSLRPMRAKQSLVS